MSKAKSFLHEFKKETFIFGSYEWDIDAIEKKFLGKKKPIKFKLGSEAIKIPFVRTNPREDAKLDFKKPLFVIQGLGLIDGYNRLDSAEKEGLKEMPMLLFTPDEIAFAEIGRQKFHKFISKNK